MTNLRMLALFSSAIVPAVLSAIVVVAIAPISLKWLGAVCLVCSLVVFPALWIRWATEDRSSWSQLGAWLTALAQGNSGSMPRVPAPIQPAIAEVSDAFALQAERISHLALVDSTTGLLSRNGFVRRLRDEHERATRFNRSLAVLSLTVTGDGLIDSAGTQSLGHRLASYARHVDLLARVGERRFALMLPETHLVGAQELARRLASDLSRDQSLPVAVGVAVFPEHAGNAERLLRCAEIAAESTLDSGASVGTFSETALDDA